MLSLCFFVHTTMHTAANRVADVAAGADRIHVVAKRLRRCAIGALVIYTHVYVTFHSWVFRVVFGFFGTFWRHTWFFVILLSSRSPHCLYPFRTFTISHTYTLHAIVLYNVF